MRNLLMIAACIFLSLSLSAQQKDVTKFLGIPVDGTKSEMIAKLKAKGFKSSNIVDGALEGEFNGRDVYISVLTNNRKVSRIMVFDITGYDEAQIRIQFNNLCGQFMDNGKYLIAENQEIPEGEIIRYEMSLRNKVYQASCFQKPIDETGRILTESDLPLEEYQQRYENKLVWFTIGEYCGEYHIVMFYENGYNMANGEDL